MARGRYTCSRGLRRRAIGMLLGLGMLTTGLSQTAYAAAATATPYLWSVPLSDRYAYPHATPDGNVIAQSDAGSAAHTSLQEFTPDGSRLWQLTDAYALPAPQTVTDAQGNTYAGVFTSASGDPVLRSVAPSGTVRWTTPIPVQGCCGYMALGWDNNIYTSQRGSYGGSQVLGFRE